MTEDQQDHRFTDERQRGFVLIVGLVILGLLTMIAISGMKDTVVQERMAGASRDTGQAFQAAEAALRAAEKTITDKNFDPKTDGHYDKSDAFIEHNDLFIDGTWANKPTGTALKFIEGGSETLESNFVIRKVADVTGESNVGISGYGTTTAAQSQKIYEIIARGKGGSGSGQSVLRTYFKQ